MFLSSLFGINTHCTISAATINDFFSSFFDYIII